MLELLLHQGQGPRVSGVTTAATGPSRQEGKAPTDLLSIRDAIKWRLQHLFLIVVVPFT